MNLATMDRSVLVLIVLAIIAVLVLGFFIYRQVMIRADLLDEIEIERGEFARLQTRLAYLEDLRDRSDELEESLDVMALLIPEKPLEDELIVHLNDEAEAVGLDFIQIRFDERAEEDGYMEMPINLSFEGRYLQAIELLKSLAESERGIRIDDIRMGRGTEELPVLNITVRGSVFYAGN